MKYITHILTLLLLILVSSCKINQTKYGNKVGRWKYKTTLEKDRDIHRGRYTKDGFQKGTWVYRRNGKRYKKEVIQGDAIYITLYHANRKVAEKGCAFLKKTKDHLHYYYHGDWLVYDTQGKLLYIKKYNTGVLLD